MKEDAIYLFHIHDAVQRIMKYTVDGEQAFHSDTKTQDAVIRNIEIIGEATRKLSDEFKNKHDEIPWQPMAGMRNILIHHYFGVKLELVWQVVVRDLPELMRKLGPIINAADNVRFEEERAFECRALLRSLSLIVLSSRPFRAWLISEVRLEPKTDHHLM